MTLARSAVAAVLAALLAQAPAKADAPLPRPGDAKTLAIHPEKVALHSGDDTAQLVVTATLADGRLVDLTHDVKYTVADGKRASVTPTGRVAPLANGTTAIRVVYGGQSAQVPVTAEHVGENLPINFPNQVVPIFTKLGCNSGGCHGKRAGQNGFRLSLLGFEPELDYMTLVKESRGRRLFPAAPDQSLLLAKATGQMPHGGGRKLDPASDEYKIVRRWIAAGMPYGSDADPVVTKISVYPEHRVLARQSKQQFAAYAHYSDGSIEDITRRAQYDSNDQEIATVDGEGLVRTLGLSGEAAIMARYQGKVAVFRATVPLGTKTPNWQFAEKTLVDKFTAKKWRQLGLVPSGLCSDEHFVRRVYLDITGTLPTPKQVRDFVADKSAAKRDRLIDRLLESPEYSYYFANKWADILRVKRRGEQTRAAGTFAFHNWIRQAVAADMPYSEFVRAILTATGDESNNPPTVWYKELQNPEQFVDDVAQVFLGQRLACANCHHHPFEKWSQDDYWGLAAFFGRLGRKNVPQPGTTDRTGLQVIFTKPTGGVTNKRTNQPAAIKPLDGEPMQAATEDDPRQMLAEWMTDPKNPFFAKAVANRYWAHFFGRGIVDPLDDMRVTNPPSNPELLDAVNQVTGSPSQFSGLPTDRYAPHRAIQLPDESFRSYFLDVFGRPQRISACECERVNEANLAQALHLLNSEEVQGKITRNGGRADLLAKDTRPDAEKVEELFLWAFARKPSPGDLQAALAHLEKNAKNKKQAYENIIWALLNTKEFVFNQ
jgi:hypothetical protein